LDIFFIERLTDFIAKYLPDWQKLHLLNILAK
jgi:hypothetical protein